MVLQILPFAEMVMVEKNKKMKRECVKEDFVKGFEVANYLNTYLKVWFGFYYRFSAFLFRETTYGFFLRL